MAILSKTEKNKKIHEIKQVFEVDIQSYMQRRETIVLRSATTQDAEKSKASDSMEYIAAILAQLPSTIWNIRLPQTKFD